MFEEGFLRESLRIQEATAPFEEPDQHVLAIDVMGCTINLFAKVKIIGDAQKKLRNLLLALYALCVTFCLHSKSEARSTNVKLA